jgi:hypothetical protein
MEMVLTIGIFYLQQHKEVPGQKTSREMLWTWSYAQSLNNTKLHNVKNANVKEEF